MYFASLSSSYYLPRYAASAEHRTASLLEERPYLLSVRYANILTIPTHKSMVHRGPFLINSCFSTKKALPCRRKAAGKSIHSMGSQGTADARRGSMQQCAAAAITPEYRSPSSQPGSPAISFLWISRSRNGSVFPNMKNFLFPGIESRAYSITAPLSAPATLRR
jgi:hypothetical protein